MGTLRFITIYWSSIVPGDKWQYRGVISIFFICQGNAESMTKQWHTLYGHAVHPEMVSWTSPCLVVFLFNDLLLPFDASRPLMVHDLFPSSLFSPTFFSSYSPPTFMLGDSRWRLGRNVRGGERWPCALPVSLSFCSYLLHCCSQFSEFIYNGDYEDRFNGIPI